MLLAVHPLATSKSLFLGEDDEFINDSEDEQEIQLESIVSTTKRSRKFKAKTLTSSEFFTDKDDHSYSDYINQK